MKISPSLAFYLGLALVIIGLALLSPLADLLPVDLGHALERLLGAGPSEPAQAYYRAMPGQASRTVEFMLVGIGALLMIGARRRK